MAVLTIRDVSYNPATQKDINVVNRYHELKALLGLYAIEYRDVIATPGTKGGNMSLGIQATGMALYMEIGLSPEFQTKRLYTAELRVNFDEDIDIEALSVLQDSRQPEWLKLGVDD